MHVTIMGLLFNYIVQANSDQNHGLALENIVLHCQVTESLASNYVQLLASRYSSSIFLQDTAAVGYLHTSKLQSPNAQMH